MRPRIGAAIAALAVAALPGTARAQAPPADTTAPTIAIVSPADNDSFTIGQPVQASYSCSDDTEIATCVGTLAQGAAIDTSTAGNYTFTVDATDKAGNAATLAHAYKVVAQDDGGAGGDTPAQLTLTLGPAAAFAPFIPGVPMDYTTTMGATVVSTAGNGQLTVADPSTVSPGHLMNGTVPLPSVLMASATSAGGTSAGFQPIADTASPTSLLTYGGPASNDQVTLTFKQTIGTTDALRTGGYGKTFVFTLSTTSP